ncbi:gliding motility-associated lipoprotein GldD [Dysgonomonas sp. PFB1-18]|uniref:gliding motility lipoprotein GldD n=1 Tax=unclassified Dysgonomonas TaxID=2630389 RepID=UPI002476B3F0|nr:MULTISPECIES: hypothetical protein [unclassified Dysgonomonas]MDH6310837.1 gliding motility-associated lipoprotein GldD [Dysgonomonas sp. PF1-14]MDH6340725.1 gliding motility-associated lipoprotein GldD [Dysgonomonas sp. PF1-16]MDH6382307.1 gliding motility-associated lipoprotein GldD [Dysgonomonas sp. PFB1-18]MDH6399657.1 gliding motility-associated lipoprotein GldD [Dysgonomonas sp. PF1-23]
MRKLFPFIFILVFLSCNEYTPKPAGYPRIERVETRMARFEYPRFSFLYPASTLLEEVPKAGQDGFWFNISYPSYNAVIYCTYLPVDRHTLSKALDDSYQLAYSHASKADGISQSQFADSLQHTSGIIYDIKGSVAVPLQFYITDNLSGFLRGSLYFDQKMDPDSIAPVVAFIREDIVRMMESLEWRNPNNRK